MCLCPEERCIVGLSCVLLNAEGYITLARWIYCGLETENHFKYPNYLNSARPRINSRTYVIRIIRANGPIRSLDSIKIAHLKLKIYIIRARTIQVIRVFIFIYLSSTTTSVIRYIQGIYIRIYRQFTTNIISEIAYLITTSCWRPAVQSHKWPLHYYVIYKQLSLVDIALIYTTLGTISNRGPQERSYRFYHTKNTITWSITDSSIQ